MAEPVPQAMIYKSKPSDASGNTTMIRGKITEYLPKSWTVRVRVLEGPAELKGNTISVSPDDFSSCTTFGREVGYLAVRRDLRSKDPKKFVADVFERSWLDWIVDLFGGDPYYLASDRVVPLHLSFPE
ncbi:MAG: hypothetical protein ABJP02_18445 [Parasphingorhabdus sp.]|uniref:hypothetical protein n=1 Tax=Parasphingorhabdus sp. TaxID=2709688 RepID=UPI003298AE77